MWCLFDDAKTNIKQYRLVALQKMFRPGRISLLILTIGMKHH